MLGIPPEWQTAITSMYPVPSLPPKDRELLHIPSLTFLCKAMGSPLVWSPTHLSGWVTVLNYPFPLIFPCQSRKVLLMVP